MRNIEEIYQEHIKPLSDKEKLYLIAIIANGLADEMEIEIKKQKGVELPKSDA